MSLEPIRVLLLFKLSFLNPNPGTPEAIMGYGMLLWVTSMRAWGSFQLEVWPASENSHSRLHAFQLER